MSLLTNHVSLSCDSNNLNVIEDSIHTGHSVVSRPCEFVDVPVCVLKKIYNNKFRFFILYKKIRDKIHVPLKLNSKQILFHTHCKRMVLVLLAPSQHAVLSDIQDAVYNENFYHIAYN